MDGTDHPIWHLVGLFGRRLDRYAADLGPGSVRVILVVASYALFAAAPVGLAPSFCGLWPSGWFHEAVEIGLKPSNCETKFCACERSHRPAPS